MTRPKAVFISDIHFNVVNLELASRALATTLECARKLGLPLVIAGDLLDTKAIIRAECANRLIELFQQFSTVKTYLLVGNHDLLNEKGKAHSLNFLRPHVSKLIDAPTYDRELDALLVPYLSSTNELKALLKEERAATKLWLMHQGLKTAFFGEYVSDKTSLDPEEFDGLRVISGHYHRAQTVRCGATGVWDYIGTPYTMTFAEANDGPKGFRILHDDGTLTQVPLDLRKHIVACLDVETLNAGVECATLDLNAREYDLVWLKVSGPTTELDKLDKKRIGESLFGHTDFKLDKIYTDVASSSTPTEGLQDWEVLDRLIDAQPEEPAQREALKELWREVLE